MKFIPRRRSKLKVKDFDKRWSELQAYCVSRKTWPMAVTEADHLLDQALKKSHFKGKTTGERLVSAQHILSFNEAVWFSHKFSEKLNESTLDVRTLKKKEVLRALAGFRQALRDLGALEKHDS